MALLHTLVDDFSAGTINTTRWPGNYGTVGQTGGRAQVGCQVATYCGWKSATSYTLTGSEAGGRFYPPAAAGAISTAYMSIFVTTTTPGTDAGYLIDVQSGFMGVLLRSAFSDGGALYYTYSPTSHAWLRIREESGTLKWEASADGDSWTTLRTASTPAWASDTTLALAIECKRADGTDNTAEFDNIGLYTARTGTASASLTLTPAASGRKQSSRTASTALSLSPAASGRKQSASTASTTLGLALTGTGRKQASGTAPAGLALALTGAGVRSHTATVAAGITLTLSVTSLIPVRPGTLIPGGTSSTLTAGATTAATLTAT
jgi:hypothetical protein